MKKRLAIVAASLIYLAYLGGIGWWGMSERARQIQYAKESEAFEAKAQESLRESDRVLKDAQLQMEKNDKEIKRLESLGY
jgi:hypothetical protein